MRITQSSFYDQYTSRQSESVGELNKTYEKVTTAKQISHGYQDPLKMVNTLNLDAQEVFFTQINTVAKQALDFSRNTDTALGDFQKTLTQFKQKLINAGNGHHSKESLNSISKELNVLVDHLRDTSNTSINRNYIFAGSDTTKRPIGDDLSYNGNDDNLGILLGKSDSLASYNVSGHKLFYGKDSDFSKVITSNVKQYNKRLLNPDIMTKNLKDSAVQKVFVNANDSIRDLLGDNDDDKTNNKDAIFYFRGQNIYGDVIKEKLTLNNDDKISTLLKKIENLYDGFVDVSMTEDGQFRLESKVAGNRYIDFHMFAAIDRDDKTKTNGADVKNIDNLLQKPKVDIIEFMYSNLSTSKVASKVASSMDSVDHKRISLRTSISKTNAKPISLNDSLQNIFHKDLNKLTIKGTNTAGKTFTKDFTVNENTDIRHLFEELQSSLSSSKNKKDVFVSFINDKLVVQENKKDGNMGVDTKISFELIANDGNLKAFRGIEAMNIDRVGFAKDKNTLFSQLPQFDRTGGYATRNTKLKDVAQGSLENSIFNIDITNINGVEKKISLNLGEDKSTFKIDNKTYNIMNDSLLYVAPNSTLNQINVPDYYDLEGVEVGDSIKINGITSIITQVDNQYKFIKVDKPFNTGIQSGDTIKFVEPGYKRTNYKNVTYGQLMDIVGMTISDTLPSKANDPNSYKEAIGKSKSLLDIDLTIRGQLKIVDKVESVSKIQLSIYDKNSNDFENDGTPAILFNANNAIVIDDPSIDFFQNLTDAVKAVESGTISSDAHGKYSRNSGIRGGIRVLDHLSSHIAKIRTIAGTNSQTIDNTISRINNTITTTKELKNEVISTDIAETMVKFNEQALNYSALLKIINKINELSLINYYK